VIEAILAIIHVATAAVWVGAMAYSLTVVQPRAERLLGERYEAFAAELAAGARWKVLGLAAVLGASGAGLVAVELAGPAPLSRGCPGADRTGVPGARSRGDRRREVLKSGRLGTFPPVI
jgi:hypothetical protein